MRQSRPGTRRFRRRLRRRTARVKASLAGRTGAGRLRLGTAGSSPWLRRAVLAAALLVVAFVPYPQQGVQSLAASVGCRAFCHQAQQDMLKWVITPLPGSWDIDSGPAGTVPATGQAYAAVGDGVVAVGIDMTVYAYRIRDHAELWSAPLTGFPAGAAIVSVRTWPDEVTAGVSFPGKDGVMARTEVVISDGPGGSGLLENEFPAAMFGGAVGGSATYTVVVGQTAVTSYDNATGRVRWQYLTGSAQTWQSDGSYLYVTEAAGGVRSINTATGAERELVATTASTVTGITSPTATATFAGTLSEAFGNVLLFSGAGGVTAYSASTGVRLWFLPGTVPDGADPVQDKLYLTRESSLLEVDPLTGRVQASAPGLGTGMYVVRDGVALGFDQESDGANGAAWGYDISTQRVVLSASPLGWPHFFIDLSGLGGGAAPDGDLVVVAACAQVGPAVQPTPAASPSPSTSDSLPLGSSPSTSGSALFSVPPSQSPSPSSSSSSSTNSPSPSTSLSPGASTSPSASISPSPTPTPSPSTTPALTCQRPELVALGL